MDKFKTLKDHVYDYIAELIREEKLIPDEHINENNICQSLNISRTPVREALIQLAAEGVLENKARKGFVVKAMTQKNIAELYSLIGILDGTAAKLSCDNLNSQDYKDMEFYIDSIDLAITSGNYEMYHKQQMLFHQIYISKCSNDVLIDTLIKSKNKILTRAYSEKERKNLKEILFNTNNEHREILKLFKAKDKEGLFRYLSEVHWDSEKAYYEL